MWICEPTEYARGVQRNIEENERNMRENIKAIEQYFQQEIHDIQQNLQLLQSTSERRTTTERNQFACIPTRTSAEHATTISTWCGTNAPNCTEWWYKLATKWTYACMHTMHRKTVYMCNYVQLNAPINTIHAQFPIKTSTYVDIIYITL